MKRILLACALLACAVFPALLSAAFSGQWRTTAQVNDSTTIGIYVTLSTGPGGVTGTAATAGTFQPIQNVAVTGTQITFTIAEPGGTTYFALTDAGDGTLEGTVRLPSNQLLSITLAPIGK